jgi:hypothetical protein
MDLQPAKVRELRNFDRDKKLKIALDMRKPTDFKSPAKYLNELAVAIDVKMSTKKVSPLIFVISKVFGNHFLITKFQKKKLIKEQTSTTILKHIEISLRTNPIHWANAFLEPPNNGLSALLNYLNVLQDELYGNFEWVLSGISKRLYTLMKKTQSKKKCYILQKKIHERM